jgi:Uma2 family endonuclease
MAATSTHLRTVEEFRKLPQDSGAVYHELRHGEIIPVTRPKLRHALIQRTLRRMLEELADTGSYVDTEVAFRPLPEFELWTADVAYLSAGRFLQIDPEDNIRGAPDLVIEVLSPSNSRREMEERERICLGNGCREFWVVDPANREIKVSMPDGELRICRSGQKIPLAMFGEAFLDVDGIFL